MRDLVMQLRELEIIQIHWTQEIEAEWTRNVIEKQDADPKSIEDCLAGMREATDGDWEIAGYDKYQENFDAVDGKDRHVAAAAYKLSLDNWPGQPVALVTRNVKDFPQKSVRCHASDALFLGPLPGAPVRRRARANHHRD